MEVPSLKGELRDLIARYLELYYVSESCKDGIKTENRYQPISVGELETPGVRSSRAEILDRIVFDQKTVLDLGSNLGELSRAARARGAALVDGLEFDPFFVELATALNSYGQVTRVSYFQRDTANTDSTNVDALINLNPRTTGPGSKIRVTNVPSAWIDTSSDIQPNFGDYTDNYVQAISSAPFYDDTLYVAWSDGRLGVPQPFEAHGIS